MAASQVPNAKQQFIDINGNPLVNGTVGMYVPSTFIAKNTWQDAAQTILNTNPIILDSRGQAIIFGTGVYRQIVLDELGNLIWDQLTTGDPGNSGGVTRTITHTQSPYTLQITDRVLLCDVSGGAIIINLLAATAYAEELSVKIKGAAPNIVTVVPNGSDTIDGQTSMPLTTLNQAVTIVSDLVSYWGSI